MSSAIALAVFAAALGVATAIAGPGFLAPAVAAPGPPLAYVGHPAAPAFAFAPVAKVSSTRLPFNSHCCQSGCLRVSTVCPKAPKTTQCSISLSNLFLIHFLYVIDVSILSNLTRYLSLDLDQKESSFQSNQIFKPNRSAVHWHSANLWSLRVSYIDWYIWVCPLAALFFVGSASTRISDHEI